MIRAVVTDIEGTTTPIHFVTGILFPHARAALPGFVRNHRTLPEVAAELAAARALAGDMRLSDEHVVDLLIRWIDEDRKATPLKTLQGLIWANGYASGAFQGMLYDDVAPMLGRWRDRGLRLFCYSSGSVEAQRLLFRYSVAGDLTALFDGFFDTHLGAKRDPRSYRALAGALALDPARILFLSDHEGELDAAATAGLAIAWLDREGAGGSGRYPVHRDFRSVDAAHLT